MFSLTGQLRVLELKCFYETTAYHPCKINNGLMITLCIKR